MAQLWWNLRFSLFAFRFESIASFFKLQLAVMTSRARAIPIAITFNCHHKKRWKSLSCAMNRHDERIWWWLCQTTTEQHFPVCWRSCTRMAIYRKPWAWAIAMQLTTFSVCGLLQATMASPPEFHALKCPYIRYRLCVFAVYIVLLLDHEASAVKRKQPRAESAIRVLASCSVDNWEGKDLIRALFVQRNQVGLSFYLDFIM